MKRVKEGNNQESSKAIQTYQKFLRTKMIHKRTFQIAKESLSRQHVKNTKAHTWRLLRPTMEMDDGTLKILMKMIKSTKITRKLDFIITWPPKITVLGIHHFYQSLKNSIAIRKIALSASALYKTSDEGLYFLCKSLKRLRFLEELTIQILAFKNINNTGFYILGEALKSLNSLRTIRLSVEYVHVYLENYSRRNEGPEKILKSLKNCHSLQNLRIVFYDANFMNLESLSKALKKLRLLQRISLKFESCNVNDDGLLCLSEGLQNLVFLEFLCLKFKRCWDITDLAISEVEEHLSELLSETEIEVSNSFTYGLNEDFER